MMIKSTLLEDFSLRGDYSIGVSSRRLWQKLFNYYHMNGGDITNLDNMLIDFLNIQDWFNVKDNEANVQPISKANFFIWSFGIRGHFTTFCHDRTWINWNDWCLEIEYIESEQSVTITLLENMDY